MTSQHASDYPQDVYLSQRDYLLTSLTDVPNPTYAHDFDAIVKQILAKNPEIGLQLLHELQQKDLEAFLTIIKFHANTHWPMLFMLLNMWDEIPATSFERYAEIINTLATITPSSAEATDLKSKIITQMLQSSHNNSSLPWEVLEKTPHLIPQNKRLRIQMMEAITQKMHHMLSLQAGILQERQIILSQLSQPQTTGQAKVQLHQKRQLIDERIETIFDCMDRLDKISLQISCHDPAHRDEKIPTPTQTSKKIAKTAHIQLFMGSFLILALMAKWLHFSPFSPLILGIEIAFSGLLTYTYHSITTRQASLLKPTPAEHAASENFAPTTTSFQPEMTSAANTHSATAHPTPH